MRSVEILLKTFPPIGREFFRRIDWKLVFLLLMPLGMIAINNDWLFSIEPGDIDEWIYTGYFLDLKQHLKTFSGTYYGTRLPWILPGHIAFHLFSPCTATHLLHLLFYYGAVLSLYLILKQLFDRRTALFTSVLMGYCQPFLHAVGWNYIDGAGITYLLLTLLMLTIQAERPFRLRLCLAGVFYGCLVYTQLFLINFTPFILLYYLFIFRKNKYPPFWRSLGLFFSGLGGITLILCTINYCLNRVFFFFLPCVEWTTEFIAHANPWWAHISLWWTEASWLVFPLVVLLGSIVYVSFNRRMRQVSNHQTILAFQVFFLFISLIFIIWEFAVGHPVLQLYYYASYLLPVMFLAIGSHLSIVINKMSRDRFYILLVGVLAMAVFVNVISVYFTSTQELNLFLMSSAFVLGVIGLWGVMSQRSAYGVYGIILVSISSALIMPNRCINPCTSQKDFLSAVCKSVRAIQEMDRKGKALFWYTAPEPVSIYRAVASTYLWGYRLVNESFPRLDNKVANRLPTSTDRVFILSNHSDAIEIANQSLAQIGLVGECVDERKIQQGSTSYNISLLKLQPLSLQHASH